MTKLRKARESDFAAICSLLGSNELVHEDLTPQKMATFLVLPVQENSSSLVAVAGLETFPQSDEGLLRSVAVVPTLRGQGIGVTLVRAIETLGRSLKIRRLWLLTTTAPDYFRRLGYVDSERPQAPEAVQQSGEFQHLCPANAICLSKRL
jgi:amino-acid N-acetyltransferase